MGEKNSDITENEDLVITEKIEHFFSHLFNLSFLGNKKTGSNFLLIMAVIVGIGSGFAAVGFRYLIEFFQLIFLGKGAQVFSFMNDYYIIIIPPLGALLFSPLIYFFAREAKGHGVPEVMSAVAFRGGRIRPRIALFKAFASALNIGSGGSVGREGPIVQIGSALGSSIGQFFCLNDNSIRTLVACGAAGGIAATFNAPIAGVLFALEVIIGQFATNTFVLTVVSSVAASVIGRTFMGDIPAFIVPEYALKSGEEYFLYVILGILAGLFGIFYTKFLYKIEDIFDSIKGIHDLLKPILGGLIIGLIAYYVPEILGVGYEFIETALSGEYLLKTLIILLFVKLIATSITIGSGGSGGVFAPGLYMGAMLGGAFGVIVNNLFPGLTAQSGAYALVGMGAVFAGSARAPITAIIILFELTNDYRIILPLMITVVISTFVANTFYKESIYTVKLSRRGLKLDNSNTDLMSKINVSEVMIENVEVLNQDTKINSVLKIMHETGHHGYPIKDLNKNLIGIVTYQDVWQAMQKGFSEKPVIEIASKKIVAITKYESLRTALRKMAADNVGRLPVVDENNDKKMIGFLTRSDILNAYNDKSAKSSS